MTLTVRQCLLGAPLLSMSLSLCAADKTVVGDWVVQVSPNSIEASTSAGGTSFGLYCQRDQCMFYLHDTLRCQPGTKSPILMSGLGSAAALNMQCAQINGVLFQILESFNSTLEVVKRGGVVSFAVPLQSGSFGVTRFSLLGGAEAIRRALYEAGKSKKDPAPIAPPLNVTPIPKPVVPGSRRLQDIMI